MANRSARAVALAAWALSIAVGAAAWLLYAELERRGVPNAPASAILAIGIGLILRNVVPGLGAMSGGYKAVMKATIPWAVVLTGAGLDLRVLLRPEVGGAGLAVTVGCMIAAFVGAWISARLVGMSAGGATLLGAGTAVCGNSAIVAVAPVVSAPEEDVAASLAAVNLYGLLVMLAVPAIAAPLGMPEAHAGVWAGTTVHAVPQAISAGAAVGETAAEIATAFKLVRVAMLAPLVLLIALITARRGTSGVRFSKLVPWFVWGFVVASALKTAGLLEIGLPRVGGEGWALGGATLGETARDLGKAVLVVAMSAIGLGIDVREFMGAGLRAAAAGLAASVILMAASYALISMLM